LSVVNHERKWDCTANKRQRTSTSPCEVFFHRYWRVRVVVTLPV
jgi:hypothetical protein